MGPRRKPGASCYSSSNPTMRFSLALDIGDPNLASGVVLLQVGANQIVIGGDARLVTWERIAGRIPKGAVVRWPHHGGAIDSDPDAHNRLRELLHQCGTSMSILLTLITPTRTTLGGGFPKQSGSNGQQRHREDSLGGV